MSEAQVPAARLVIDDDSDELARVLRITQQLVLQHPAAAQALFAAFVREGRAYAETAEGRAWQARLASSELVRRARVLWDMGTVGLLEDDQDAVLPSKLLDVIVQCGGVEALEPLMARLFAVNSGSGP